MIELCPLYFERYLLLEREESQSRVQAPDEVKLNTENIVDKGWKIVS